MRSRACSVSVYRTRFVGNLALNSHRAAISRHSAGVATLLRATLTYVITRICDHCGAHRRCLFSAYRRQHVRLIKLPSSPLQLYFVRVVRTSSLLQNGGQNFLTRESKESTSVHTDRASYANAAWLLSSCKVPITTTNVVNWKWKADILYAFHAFEVHTRKNSLLNQI